MAWFATTPSSFFDVAPKPKMRPAGKSGQSLILSRSEMKQFEPCGLLPGGKIPPSIRLDGPKSDTAMETSVSSSQRALNAEPAGRRITFPSHNALASSALGDALDGEKSDPKEIVRRLHVHRGHAAAQQLERAMAGEYGRANGLIPLVGDVVRECDICRALDAAPAIPVAGTSSTSSLD